MICNKCGQENPDDLKFCLGCGHKLQSGRQTASVGEVLPDDLNFSLMGLGPSARRKARKHIEAWGVAVVLCGAAYGLLAAKLQWPFYPLALLAGAYAWWRGITWND
jgi:uncharacterized membrane protein YvbJ